MKKMQQEVCSICQRTRLDASQWKTLLDEPNCVSLNQENNFNNTLKYNNSRLYLCQAIEFISGCKIDDEKQVPLILCDKCIERLQTCMNFRAEIRLNLFRIVDETSDPKNHSLNVKSNWQSEVLNCHSPSISLSKPDEKIFHRLKLEQGIDILINVDENSKSPSIHQDHLIQENLHNDNPTEDIKDRDDKNFSDYNGCELSNSSNVSFHEKIILKTQDTDIESEIDVCSGEDDEILELDRCPRKNETVNISSSSESEVEVCDYEPVGKRSKKYQVFPSSVSL